MATRQQLKDIERFCTNPENVCVLGVDVNFDTCDYYLTLYRNKMLVTKKGNPPVHVGPALLHKQKRQSSYFVLPMEMLRWHFSCAGVLDGEYNLSNSLFAIFNDAYHLRCDIHMKDNILKEREEKEKTF